MAQLKSTVVQGSLRVTDTTYTTNLNLASATASQFVKTDANKNLITGTIAAADIPTLSITDKTSGTLTVGRGGTGVASFTANSLIMSGSTTTAALTTRAVTNNTSATKITASTNIPTMNTLYYGLPIINNSHEYTSNTAIYAPTAGGTAGYVLIGAGTTSAPAWYAGLTLTGAAAASYVASFAGTTAATSKTTGAVQISGGLGVSGDIWSTKYNGLTLTAASTGFTIAGGTTSKTLTVNNTYTLGAACAYGVDDATGNGALSTGTGLTTERSVYYGLVTVNNASQTRATGIYAPISAGTANQILVSAGGTSAPTWKATANGAAYATSANGALTFGTLPIAQGGTGITSTNPHQILIGPSTGTTANTPTWRTLVAADLPTAATNALGIMQVGTGLGVSSGTVSVNYGTSANTALEGDTNLVTLNGLTKTAASIADFYAPISAGTNGQFLKSVGSGEPTWSALPTASTTVAGIVKLGASGGAATYEHTHAANAVIKSTDISWSNVATYTYSDSWITAGTAIVATDLQYKKPAAIIEWVVSAGKIVFTCSAACTISFSIMMLKQA